MPAKSRPLSRSRLSRRQRLICRAAVLAVAQATGQHFREILGPRRTEALATARHLAMHLAIDLGGLTTPVAGGYFRRHPSTFVYARRRIRELAETHPATRDALQAATAAFRTERTDGSRTAAAAPPPFR